MFNSSFLSLNSLFPSHLASSSSSSSSSLHRHPFTSISMDYEREMDDNDEKEEERKRRDEESWGNSNNSLLSLLSLLEVVAVGVEGSLGESVLGPEVGGEEPVRLANGVEGGHGEVAAGLGVALSAGVHILDTRELEDLLRDGGSDDAGTTGSGHKTHTDGTAGTSELHRNGVGETDAVTPVPATDGDDGELGDLDGTLDGVRNLLAALGAEAHVTVLVTDDNKGFEASALPGAGLLLHGHHTHDLVGDVGEELVDNLVFLDGDAEVVQLLDRFDAALLHKAPDLGAGNPVLLALLLVATGRTTATTATATAESTTSLTISCSVSHLIYLSCFFAVL